MEVGYISDFWITIKNKKTFKNNPQLNIIIGLKAWVGKS